MKPNSYISLQTLPQPEKWTHRFLYSAIGGFCFLLGWPAPYCNYGLILLTSGVLANLFFGGKAHWRKPSKVLIFSSLYFLVLLAGYFYSENKARAILIIGYNAPLVYLPILLIISRYNRQKATIQAIKGFCYGIGFLILTCLFYALFMKLKHNEADYWRFYYHDLGTPFKLPAGIFSTYIIIALGCVNILKNKLKSWQKVAINLLCLGVLILLNTKVLLLFTLVVSSVFALKRYYTKANKWKVFAWLIIFSAFILAGTIHSPLNRARLIDSINFTRPFSPGDTGGSGIRRITWGSSLQIIEQNWCLGVGTGDGSSALDNVYRQNGKDFMLYDWQGQFNCHNAYLEVLLANGIIGLVALMAMLITAGYMTNIGNNVFLLRCTVSLICWYSLTESLLTTYRCPMLLGIVLALSIINEKDKILYSN